MAETPGDPAFRSIDPENVGRRSTAAETGRGYSSAGYANTAQALAAAYTPIVRGYFLAAGAYYIFISASHPFFETGRELVVLQALSLVAAGFGVLAGWALPSPRRPTGPRSSAVIEGLSLCMNGLILANVAAYLAIHFEPAKLSYFILMALVFGTAAPSRRIAVVSTTAAILSLLWMAMGATEEIFLQYLYIGVASSFAALGMSFLMRGAVLRAIGAKLTSDALNRTLTAELRKNEELRKESDRLAAEAQAADRAKSEFLATISHEIRTPLNGLLGIVQVMERTDSTERQAEFVASLKSSGSALSQVINAVLDISKMEVGQFEISPEAFCLPDFVESLRQIYSGLFRDAGLSIVFEIEAGSADWRFADQVRLRQILSNLISNALKFTETGGVVVAIRGDAERLTCDVRDTGVGVPAAEQSRIFDRFTQVDSSNTRRAGGTGLGLAICRELADLMGGEITYSAQDGGGSRFTLRLPAPAVAAPGAAPGSAKAKPGEALGGLPALRVLIADDNATNQLVLRTLLDQLGCHCTVADDGQAAVDQWQLGRWDLILMDVHMPRLDGVSAAREIRAREIREGRARTPIIAVTASVLAHETRAYFDAGMDDVIGKPIDVEQLIACVEALLCESPQPTLEGVRALG